MVHNAALILLLIGTHMQREIQVVQRGLELIATHDGNCEQQAFYSLSQNESATKLNKQIGNMALVAAVMDFNSLTMIKSYVYTPICQNITNRPKSLINMFTDSS